MKSSNTVFACSGCSLALFLCVSLSYRKYTRHVAIIQIEKSAAGAVAGIPHARAENKTFICVRGRVLPILQMLGVQKAASTQMYDDLCSVLGLRTDMECHQGKRTCASMQHCKEPQILTQRPDPGVYHGLWGACNTWGDRGVVSDFTPDHVWPRGMPHKMAAAYGPFGKDIVFVVGFREPKKRMMSAFFHGVRDGWLYGNQVAPSFQGHVDAYFHAAHLQHDDWWVGTNNFKTVLQGLYYENLRHCLEAGFGASQFIVFPGKVYLNHRDNLATNPVLQAMRARLGSSRLRPDINVDLHNHPNKGSHKTLEELLNNVTLQRLDRDLFGPQNRLLAELLASKMANGMVLVGYEGQAFDAEAVLAWLESNWDY